MKKTIIFAGLALFAVSAFAQNNTDSDSQGTAVSTVAKETTLEGKEKGQAISEIAKSKSTTHRHDDLNNDGKLSREERKARRAERREQAEADRADDGIINGAADGNNVHGTAVRDIAKETALEGREKGEAIRDAARSKARNGERVQRPEARKPDNVGRPSGSGKPAGAGRPAGRGKG